jgi:hypothetical protein
MYLILLVHKLADFRFAELGGMFVVNIFYLNINRSHAGAGPLLSTVYVSFLCHCEMLSTTFVMVSSIKISLCSILSQSFSFTYTYLPVLSTDLVYITACKYVTYKSFTYVR